MSEIPITRVPDPSKADGVPGASGAVTSVVPLAFGGGNVDESAFTDGAIIFKSGTTLAQDPTNLFWDSTNKWLGVGTVPSFALHVVGSTTSTSALISSGDFTLTVGNASSSAQAYFGVHALVHKNAGAAAITGDLRGGWFISKNSTSQSVSSLYGIVAECQSTGSGTISQISTLYAGSPTSSGGATITIAYGLSVAAQKVTGVVTAYGVYQVGASDLNYFAGNAQFNQNVGVGTAAVSTAGVTTSHTFADPSGSVAGISALATLTTTSNNANTLQGALLQAQYGGANSLTADFTSGSYVGPGIIGCKVGANITSSSTVTSIAAFGFQILLRNGCTVTHAAGVVIDSCVNDVGAATVTNVYDVYVKDTLNTTLTLTNHYAFYVAAMSHGTNKWAFYNNSAANNFLGTGKTGAGSVTAPSWLFDIGQTRADTASTNILAQMVLTCNPASSSSATFDALTVNCTSQSGNAQTFTASQGLVGVAVQSIHNGTATATGIASVFAQARKASTGVVTNAYGLYSQVRNENATGAITSGYGLYIDSPVKTGAITNSYGVYQVDTGDLNFFGGKIGIGANPPTARLHIAAESGNANEAPLKFTTSGLIMSSAEDGAMEFASDLFFTNVNCRYGMGGVLSVRVDTTTNSTTSETDLYSYSLRASALTAPSLPRSIAVRYGGNVVGHATATKQFRIYFGGTVILDTGALTVATNQGWSADAFIVPDSSSSVRYDVRFFISGITTEVYLATGTVTGLTFSNSLVLKITGQAASTGAASSQLNATTAIVTFYGKPPATN